MLESAIELLKKLIQTPSLSKQEHQTADILLDYLQAKNAETIRIQNNIIAQTNTANKDLPIIVLNSHHDTVKVSDGWTKDPFGAEEIDQNIFGLGSNDAGASLVCLLHTFLHFKDHEHLPFQLYFIASAEEEISGKNGLELVLKELNISPDVAIVGEPTSCNMAIAEKGLIVIDALAKGKAGHAANQIGDNAIYQATKDIAWIENYEFAHISDVLGKVKITVTQIEAGYQHNVVPDACKFVIDCRINEGYSFTEIMDILNKNCASELTARSLRLKPSSIPMEHPLVMKGKRLGLSHYGSNTMSDQVFFSCPSLKIGPGDTNRSHKADEYISIEEIKQGLETYIALLDNLKI